MKLRSKLMSGLGVVISVAALGAGSAIDATAADAGVVAFRAPTTSLTFIPPIAAAPAGVLQSGIYSFSSNGGLCAAAEVEGDTSPPSVNGPGCVITSNNGSYLNVICGTGTAQDATATVGFPSGDVESTPYQIVFVAGVGVILPLTPGSGGQGVGVVQITPTIFPTENCVTAGVNSFTASGITVAETTTT